MTTDTGKPLRKRRKLTKIASEPVLRTPRLTFTAVASNHRGTYNVLSEQTFLPNPTAPLRPAGLSPPDRYDTQPSDTVFPTFSPSDIPKNKRVPKNAVRVNIIFVRTPQLKLVIISRRIAILW